MPEKDTNQGQNDTPAIGAGDKTTERAPEAVPTIPHATQKSAEDVPPALYVQGWGVMGQGTPDVATGSTPVTRKDD